MKVNRAKVRWCTVAALYKPGTESALPHSPSIADKMLNRKKIRVALGGSVPQPERRKAARRIAMRTDKLLGSEQVTDGGRVAKPSMLLNNLSEYMAVYADLVHDEVVKLVNLKGNKNG
jgi:hypothetical protein